METIGRKNKFIDSLCVQSRQKSIYNSSAIVLLNEFLSKSKIHEERPAAPYENYENRHPHRDGTTLKYFKKITLKNDFVHLKSA